MPIEASVTVGYQGTQNPQNDHASKNLSCNIASLDAIEMTRLDLRRDRLRFSTNSGYTLSP